MQSSNRFAVGVFDSGLGGLTAVRALRTMLPHEHIIYFGDTGRVPYGTRSRDTIIRYARQDIAFLLRQGVKLILAACGTVSSTLPAQLTAALPVPYLGVVHCTAQAAVRATRTGRIGIIGTAATIASQSYEHAIMSLLPKAQLTAQACPLLVPLVENGYFSRDNQVTRLVAQDYLHIMQQANIDTLILGCTHYPLIAPIISDIMGPRVTLIDSGREAAACTAQLLHTHGLLHPSSGHGTARFFVSDNTDSFARLAAPFLGELPAQHVSHICIDQETPVSEQGNSQEGNFYAGRLSY